MASLNHMQQTQTKVSSGTTMRIESVLSSIFKNHLKRYATDGLSANSLRSSMGTGDTPVQISYVTICTSSLCETKNFPRILSKPLLMHTTRQISTSWIQLSVSRMAKSICLTGVAAVQLLRLLLTICAIQLMLATAEQSCPSAAASTLPA